MDREGHVCPVCGQPVASVVQRYKTLGAWVPRWVAGPCHNPGCEVCVDPVAEDRPEEEQPADRPEGRPQEGDVRRPAPKP